MKYTLMDLPFSYKALEPMMSEETLKYHHDKHHAGYVKKLNALLKESEFDGMPLEEIIKKADGTIFSNAAQVFNHDFFWNCLTPKNCEPSTDLEETICNTFQSLDNFKKEFINTAASLFGSGWTWLSLDEDNKLHIEKSCNANNPLSFGRVPLLTCDVWEHAYYIDYRNARAEYLENWWNLINWNFVSENLEIRTEKKLQPYIQGCNSNRMVCDFVDSVINTERIES